VIQTAEFQVKINSCTIYVLATYQAMKVCFETNVWPSVAYAYAVNMRGTTQTQTLASLLVASMWLVVSTTFKPTFRRPSKDLVLSLSDLKRLRGNA